VPNHSTKHYFITSVQKDSILFQAEAFKDYASKFKIEHRGNLYNAIIIAAVLKLIFFAEKPY
jgi:hypothetical protein